jgi:hypothetical protein
MGPSVFQSARERQTERNGDASLQDPGIARVSGWLTHDTLRGRLAGPWALARRSDLPLLAGGAGFPSTGWNDLTANDTRTQFNAGYDPRLASGDVGKSEEFVELDQRARLLAEAAVRAGGSIEMEPVVRPLLHFFADRPRRTDASAHTARGALRFPDSNPSPWKVSSVRDDGATCSLTTPQELPEQLSSGRRRLRPALPSQLATQVPANRPLGAVSEECGVMSHVTCDAREDLPPTPHPLSLSWLLHHRDRDILQQRHTLQHRRRAGNRSAEQLLAMLDTTPGADPRHQAHPIESEKRRADDDVFAHPSQARNRERVSALTLRLPAPYDEPLRSTRFPVLAEQRCRAVEQVPLRAQAASDRFGRAGVLAQPAIGAAIAHDRAELQRNGVVGTDLDAPAAVALSEPHPLAEIGERGDVLGTMHRKIPQTAQRLLSSLRLAKIGQRLPSRRRHTRRDPVRLAASQRRNSSVIRAKPR